MRYFAANVFFMSNKAYAVDLGASMAVLTIQDVDPKLEAGKNFMEKHDIKK